MFALFAGDTYYPGGGWSDFVGVFDTTEEAEKAAALGWLNEDDETYRPYDWHHIVNLVSQEVVSPGGNLW